MLCALPCISDGAVSLDGGIIRRNGLFYLGNRYPWALFFFLFWIICFLYSFRHAHLWGKLKLFKNSYVLWQDVAKFHLTRNPLTDLVY